MKKIVLILFGLLLVPAVALAVFNDVTVSDSADILLPDNGLTYTLTNATRVEDFTVNSTNILFTMQDNSIIELKSADRSKFTYSAGCEVLSQTCTASLSTIAMQCRTSITLTITPGAASTCSGGSAGNSSGGGGGSSGGGSETATPTTSKTDTTVVLNLNNPFTLSLSLSAVSHTVSVSSASDAKVEFTISSDPLKVALNKGETKDLDTDGDGVNDLQVTYSGLDASSGKPKIRFVELAATTGVKTETAACALNVGEAFKSAGSPAVWYITKYCEKRAFNNSRVFFTYFDGWSDVKVVQKSTLDGLANDGLGFMPWGSKYDPKYGALVKIVTDPKVYLLLGSEKYWITDEAVFNALGYYWNWIEDIDEALLNKYTTGSEINYTDRHPNFTLVKYADDPKVYRLEGGKKRHIKDEAAFVSLGYRWDRIVTISDSEGYDDGEQLSANSGAGY